MLMSFRVSIYDEVRDRVELAEYADQFLEVQTRRSGGTPYQCICPSCGSGEGRHHSGAFTLNPKDPLHWKCFSCNRKGDIFDLAGIINGTDKLSEQVALVAEWAHIDLEGIAHPDLSSRLQMAFNRKRRAIEREEKLQAQLEEWEKNKAQEAVRISQLPEASSSDEAMAYLSSRNIDRETADKWQLRYDSANKRVVIPYKGSVYYHVDRDITGHSHKKYDKPNSGTYGPEPMWNPSALDSAKFILVEGQLDALAVDSLGFNSVACGGCGLAPTLSEIKLRGGFKGKVLIMHDNDDAGHTADELAAKELKAIGVKCCIFNKWGEGINDPFEWWQHDRAGLELALHQSLVGESE